MIALNTPSMKTIYIGTHDGQNFGETPTFKFEPELIRANMTHSQSVRIVARGLAEMKKALAEELNLVESSNNGHSDNGAWPG